MGHQLPSDSSRLAPPIGFSPSYGLPSSYPSPLLPSTSPSTSHVQSQHPTSTVTVTVSTPMSYPHQQQQQQPVIHQLPPTPNSLVNMMSPNSSSNPASESLPISDLSIGSTSPNHHHHHQTSQVEPASWNSIPSAKTTSSSHHHSQLQQGYMNYGQSFQQPARTHQPYYWY